MDADLVEQPGQRVSAVDYEKPRQDLPTADQAQRALFVLMRRAYGCERRQRIRERGHAPRCEKKADEGEGKKPHSAPETQHVRRRPW